ncbi:choice-of-anchor P family protein [Nocardioides sp. Bht2]|uniref:choice-of-anchor P family protein n=1 Tax=Nocardioides sp. Bht2 TaxID=3392297 RepID=UPI0039B3D1B1
MRRIAVVGATLLVGAALPWSAAADEETPAAPTFGGYSSTAWATPVHVEVFEPSLPIPSSPQLEFMMAYSKAKADSGSSSSRASWFWPGDPVGEGLKTFGEQLGLPPQLFAGGYPVQVNAVYPSDSQSQKDEPFPGMVMRASADGELATGSTGFSPDSDVEEVPASSGLAGNLLQTLGLGQLTGAAKQESGVPGMPAGLSTLIDFNGYVSTSKTALVDGKVQVTSKSRLGDVSLLGGLIKLEGVSSVATASSDGSTGQAGGKASYGGMTIAGQEFGIGPDGVVAMGKTQAIPFLSDNPAAALEQLGVTFTVPKPERRSEGNTTVSVSRGLVIEIKTDILSPLLSALPLAQLAELMPAEAGMAKSLVAGLGSLAPRIVLTLGEARANLETVPPVSMPGTDDGAGTPPATDPGSDDGAGTPASEDGTGSLPDAPAAPDAPSVDTPTTAAGDLPPVQPVAAGLPKLFSISGGLLLGGMAIAAAIGSWFRRAGLLALGAGGACTHGLDSGLPDLRKV